MKSHFEMDGDRWVATIDRQAAHDGMDAVVFNCISNSYRPWRVIEVPARAGRDPESDPYSEQELRQFFENAQPMDFPREEAAGPERHGEGS